MAQRGAGRRIVDGVPLVVVLWSWVLPATVLWQLAAKRDLVVPFVPWFVWVVPGRLWAFSPPLWCIGLALATLAAHLVLKEALPRRKSVVGAIWILTVSVGAVHLIWGSAVVRATRAWKSGVSSSRADRSWECRRGSSGRDDLEAVREETLRGGLDSPA
jgi:hypothetical protein